MKFNRYFSILSILIALVVIGLKIEIDITTYHAFQDADNKSAIPDIFGGLSILPMSLIIISLLFAVLGLEKKNKFRVLALTLSIIAIFYLLVPFGLFLVRN